MIECLNEPYRCQTFWDVAEGYGRIDTELNELVAAAAEDREFNRVASVELAQRATRLSEASKRLDSLFACGIKCPRSAFNPDAPCAIDQYLAENPGEREFLEESLSVNSTRLA
jgi:hypothetical protein